MNIMSCGDNLFWLNTIPIHVFGRWILRDLPNLLGVLFVKPLIWWLSAPAIILAMVLPLFFWKDPWLSCGVLSSTLPRLFHLARFPNIMVADV